MSLDWNVVSSIGAAVSALAAAIAAYLSFMAMTQARAAAAEQRASEFVKTYLELAIQFPKLSTEGSAQKQEAQRYEWFVAFALMMAGEVMKAHPRDLNWRRLMFDQLDYNEEELRAWKKDDPKVFEPFGPEIEALVNDVLAGKRPA